MSPPSQPTCRNARARAVAVQTQIGGNIKTLYARMQMMMGRRRSKPSRKKPEISAPFDCRTERVVLPGISDDEMDVMREQALASRIGTTRTPPARSGPTPIGPGPGQGQGPTGRLATWSHRNPPSPSPAFPASPASPASGRWGTGLGNDDDDDDDDGDDVAADNHNNSCHRLNHAVSAPVVIVIPPSAAGSTQTLGTSWTSWTSSGSLL